MDVIGVVAAIGMASVAALGAIWVRLRARRVGIRATKQERAKGAALGPRIFNGLAVFGAILIVWAAMANRDWISQEWDGALLLMGGVVFFVWLGTLLSLALKNLQANRELWEMDVGQVLKALVAAIAVLLSLVVRREGGLVPQDLYPAFLSGYFFKEVAEALTVPTMPGPEGDPPERAGHAPEEGETESAAT